jgi:hypothetical protein
MPRDVRIILWLLLLCGFTSVLYFFSLIAHVPVIVTTLVVAGWAGASLWWMLQKIAVWPEAALSTRNQLRAYVVFAGGLAVIVSNAYIHTKQYGHWDAWWLWDHKAKYLQGEGYWRELFALNDSFHPDYPLFLSSLVAFVWRVMGSYNHIVPFTFSMMVAVCSPALIFLSLYRRNLIVASLAFLSLAFSSVFVNMSVALYADQPLAFLFLSAFVCVRYAHTDNRLVAITAAFLGCCMWMKNEGMMLAIIFTLFYARTLLAGGRYKWFAAGIALPLLAWVVLKLGAPANDLVKGQGGASLVRLTDMGRYQLIGKHYYGVVTAGLMPLVVATAVYLLYCYQIRRWPGKNLLLLLTCVVGYTIVYVLTPLDLEWHLSTSADRILFQLVPAFIYVMASNFCNVSLVSNSHSFE